jgi:hypothetical protein
MGISLGMLLDELRGSGFDCQYIDASLDFDLDSPVWARAEIVCAGSPRSIVIEHYIGGFHGTLVEDEALQLLGRLKPVEESWNKREVVVYLRMSRELFVIQIEGGEAEKMKGLLDRCLQLFETMGEGLLYVEGEGFFNKGKLILPLTKG